MKAKWNLFWEDYAELFAASNRFCKKHWFGTMVYMIITIGYIVACMTDVFEDIYFWINDRLASLKDKIKSVFTKAKRKTK